MLSIRIITIFITLIIGAMPLIAWGENTGPELAGTWLSVLPPVVAILVALVFKRVIPALFTGVFLGAWLIEGLTVKGFWIGLLSSFEIYVVNALANRDHTAIILFSLCLLYTSPSPRD